MAHQQLEKLKFLGTQFDFVPATMHFARRRIQLQIFHAQHVQRWIGLSAQQCICPRGQFLKENGLVM